MNPKLLIYLFYTLGQLLHFWTKADAWQLSVAERTLRAYWSRYKRVLVLRFIYQTGLFVLWTEGAAAMLGDDTILVLAKLPIAAQAVLCLFVGLAADSLLDKALNRLPPSLAWLKGEVPPAPTGQTFIGDIPLDRPTRPPRNPE